jgi:hypothetical protein
MSLQERILGALSSQIYLDIATACLNEPKTSSRLAEELGYKKINIGQWIQQLELQGILKFTDKGWKTTEEAVPIIKKYFL